MKLRGHPWLLAVLLLAGGLAIVVGGRYLRSSSADLTTLVHQLPVENSLLIHVDITGIRSAGFMSAVDRSAAVEDPEYRRFVTDSGFDWKSDLETVTLARAGENWYLFAQGRFDWAKLHAYATNHGGRCYNGVCDAPAVTPGRRVSFYPKTRNILAMATSERAFAVNDLQNSSRSQTWTPPAGPVWISMTGSFLAKSEPTTPGTRLFAKALTEANRSTFRVHAGAGEFELQMEADCSGEREAESLYRQLSGVTAEFAKYFERLGQSPSPSDMSGLLLNGKFSRQGARVSGRWPLNADLIRSLLAGG